MVLKEGDVSLHPGSIEGFSKLHAVKRHSALAHFSRDHHKALIVAQFIRKETPHFKGLPETVEEKVQYVIRFYNEELRGHFEREEEILFPFIKNLDSDTDSMVSELIEEHRKLESMVKQLSSGSEPADNLDQLGRLLESHIRKEERILFKDLQEKLPQNKFAILEQMLIGDINANGKNSNPTT